ncbi:MAG: DUF3761 domain-containing protein [Acidobacteriota bacterium]|nr:DUF3761 domain-containing protein [Acidobacteriota bacterium]
MKRAVRFAAVTLVLVGGQLLAQTAAPAGSTGQCKDGTYSTASSKQGACRGHKGVKEWYAASSTTPGAPAAKGQAPAGAPAPTSTPAVAGSAAPVPAAAATASRGPKTSAGKVSPAAAAAARPLAPGGGAGLVWVNTSSNVYHCYGTDFYGKTKAGAYMSEADAKAKGAHADRGRACSK